METTKAARPRKEIREAIERVGQREREGETFSSPTGVSPTRGEREDRACFMSWRRGG